MTLEKVHLSLAKYNLRSTEPSLEVTLRFDLFIINKNECEEHLLFW